MTTLYDQPLALGCKRSFIRILCNQVAEHSVATPTDVAKRRTGDLEGEHCFEPWMVLHSFHPTAAHKDHPVASLDEWLWLIPLGCHRGIGWANLVREAENRKACEGAKVIQQERSTGVLEGSGCR